MTTKDFYRRRAANEEAYRRLASVILTGFCLTASLTALAFTFAYFSF